MLCLHGRIGCSSRSDHMLPAPSVARCERTRAFHLLNISMVTYIEKQVDTPIRIAARPTSFNLLSIVENDEPTPSQIHGRSHRGNEEVGHTSNPLFNSAIFFEYSRSDTLTLFSSCSDFVCTSFRIAIRRSTAASNVRIKGLGSKATKRVTRRR